ncbi:hypothetical protein GCM10027051_28240 [Niabella terrae]
MPIQIERGKFVQFRYEPSYLKDNSEVQSDFQEVCTANKIDPQFSKSNLDGGNNWLLYELLRSTKPNCVANI